jgi:hypothetical protein
LALPGAPAHLVLPCDFASQFLDAKAADDDHIPMVLPETGHSVFQCFGVSVGLRKQRPIRTVSFTFTETPRA